MVPGQYMDEMQLLLYQQFKTHERLKRTLFIWTVQSSRLICHKLGYLIKTVYFL